MSVKKRNPIAGMIMNRRIVNLGDGSRNMKDFMDEYEKAIDKAKKLFKSKSEAYLDGNSIFSYWIHGEDDLVYEIYKKALRLARTSGAKSRRMLHPSIDSMKDSAIDLINYAAFLYAYLESKEKGKDE